MAGAALTDPGTGRRSRARGRRRSGEGILQMLYLRLIRGRRGVPNAARIGRPDNKRLQLGLRPDRQARKALRDFIEQPVVLFSGTRAEINVGQALVAEQRVGSVQQRNAVI